MVRLVSFVKQNTMSAYLIAVSLLVLLGVVLDVDRGHRWRLAFSSDAQSELWRVRTARASQDELSRALGMSGKFFATGVFKAADSSLKALVIGDSHVGRLDEFLENAAKDLGISFYVAWKPCWIGLPNLVSIPESKVGKNSPGKCAQDKRFWSLVYSSEFDAILYVGRYSVYTAEQTYGSSSNRSRRLIVRLSSNDEPEYLSTDDALAHFKGHWIQTLDARSSDSPPVVIMGQVPPPEFKHKHCNSLPSWLAIDYAKICYGAKKEDAAARLDPLRIMFSDVAANVPDVRFFDTFDYFCPAANQRCISYIRGRPLFSDDNHLTKFGSKFLWDRSREDFIALMRSTIGIKQK